MNIDIRTTVPDWSTCYKVFSVRNKAYGCYNPTFRMPRLHSVLNNRLSVQYNTQGINYPRTGKLFVFAEMPSSQVVAKILDIDTDFRIYRCLGLNLSPAAAMATVGSTYSMEAFWNDYKVNPRYALDYYDVPPTGTYYVDAVRLTKNITKEWLKNN